MNILIISIFASGILWASDSQKSNNIDENNLLSSIRKMTWRNENVTNIEKKDFVKCGVPILKHLANNSNELSHYTKNRLSEMGVDTSRKIAGFGRPKDLDQTYDSSIFRIHYTLSGRHGIDSTDNNENGTPDFVELMAKTAEKTYKVEVLDYGYNRPPSDKWISDNGGTDAYDIYILDIGETLYGYTQMEYMANNLSGDNEFSDEKEEFAITSYIAMNKDYSYFPCDEDACVKFTFSHEFFHAIQFGYDAWDEIWMLESSAVWMEDEVFDDINDNYYYLDLWMKQPHMSLNYNRSPHWYGSWIFFRYLSEHLGVPSTIKQIFERSVKDISKGVSDNSISSIDRVLREKGSSFRESLNQMAIANHLLTSNLEAGQYRYEEGDAYRNYGIEPHLTQSFSLTDTETIIEYTGSQLMHNATHYIGLNSMNQDAIKLIFESLEDSLRFNVNLVHENGKYYSVHRIRGNSIVPTPKTSDKFTVIIVTDTIPYGTYNYRLDINTDVNIPSEIALSPNFPNPFNANTTLRFYLPKWEDVNLSIVDLLGREVKKIDLLQVQTGYNEIILEGKTLPSGTYLVKLDGETKTVAQKIMVIK